MESFKICSLINHDYWNNNFNESKNQIRKTNILKKLAIVLIEDFQVRHFICGIKFGFEQSFVEIVLELKEKYPNIKIEVLLPYEIFPIEKNPLSRDSYYFLMQRIDKETLMQYHYTKDCIRKSEKYMIKESDYIIFLPNCTNEVYDINLYRKTNKKFVKLTLSSFKDNTKSPYLLDEARDLYRNRKTYKGE